jgi:hypothetical protein
VFTTGNTYPELTVVEVGMTKIISDWLTILFKSISDSNTILLLRSNTDRSVLGWIAAFLIRSGNVVLLINPDVMVACIIKQIIDSTAAKTALIVP